MNSRQPPWQGGALPLSYTRSSRGRFYESVVNGRGKSPILGPASPLPLPDLRGPPVPGHNDVRRPPRERPLTDETDHGCVKISGAWQGAILLECPESIVRHAAVMLFAADGEETPEDDIQDAVKELADMFGKKMRPFLPDETKISRPSVVEDQDNCKALSGMQSLSELKLSCEGRLVRIVLFEAAPDLAATG